MAYAIQADPQPSPSEAPSVVYERLLEERKAKLFKQGYRLAGTHSAVKVCGWTKKSLRDEGSCYKGKFYGIHSHQCVQMSPVLDFCNLACQWCWRDINYQDAKLTTQLDDPKTIVDQCLRAHKEILQGFKGNINVRKEKFIQAMQPKHFAVSLTGEVTFYPKLPELIAEIQSRGMTAFVVTNGTNPHMVRKMLSEPEFQPTQLYMTLPAPNEELYLQSCKPLDPKNSWNKIMETLSLLHQFPRSVVRCTLVKGLNMTLPDQYAELLKGKGVDFVECKAYMPLGTSTYRLAYTAMPSHDEIVAFARELGAHLNYHFLDHAPQSRVALLSKHPHKIYLDGFAPESEPASGPESESEDLPHDQLVQLV